MPIARCPDCGGDLANGLCSRCLVKLGLDGVGPAMGGPDDTLDLPARPGSVLETIAATIGHVPRVLLRDTAWGEEPSPIVRPSHGQDSSTRYRIDGEIARGGMGAILKGRDPDLGRDVAIKVLREDLSDNDDLVRRFVEEAQIGGQLQHPGIVPIYELGTFADRRPFFCMKLVKGQTLAELLASRPSPSAELPRFLAIFAAMAQTMAYAHTRGVIHRDLKPSNVMVGSFGEVQVMDWGLAKVLARGGIAADAKAGREKPPETMIATARSGSDLELSHAGSVLGTPSYMPPEQARGETDLIDERADVFALGSILGEMLTDAPAFTGRSSGEILRKAARGDTSEALARLAACGAEAELIALVGDSLAVEPEDRPRDANVVAERITAYLAGVQEKLRTSERDRAVAEAQAVEERKQRRLQAGLAAAVLALMVMGGGGYAWNERQTAERVAKTARGVDEAMAEVARLRGEAQAGAPGAPTKWAEAASAARRAQGLLAQGESDAPLKSRVTALLAQVEGEQAAAAARARQIEVDRALLAELESVRGNRAEHWDWKQADDEYGEAFRKAGLDVDRAEPAESRKWMASRTGPVELAGYLDDWSFVRRQGRRPEPDWQRPVAAARAGDPDPWRDALRSKTGGKDAGAVEEFRRLADDEPALEAQPTPSLVLLAIQLRVGAGDIERAVRVLRRAVSRDPADFWAQYELSRAHGASSADTAGTMYPRPEESVRHLTAAVAIRPRSSSARVSLGLALQAQNKFDEAIAVYRETIRLKPDFANPHIDLGNALLAQNKLDESIAAYREAIRLKPDDALAYSNLGWVLIKQGKLDQAVAACREAIRLRPDYARGHSNLGWVLSNQGKQDQALAACLEAIRLRPDLADAHANLGLVLDRQGRPDQALAAYREAVRLDPNDANSLANLRMILKNQGKLDAETAQLRVLVEKARKEYGPADPRIAGPLVQLGTNLVRQGRGAEAEPLLRECLAIREKAQPDEWTTFNTRATLGEILVGQGKYAEAEPLILSGFEGIKARLGRKPAGAEQRLAEAAERAISLYDAWGKPEKAADWRARLKTRTPAEWVGAAQMAQDRGHYAAMVRYTVEALGVAPTLVDAPLADYHFNAVCAALLAAAGQAKDEPFPDADARVRFRTQARAWLEAELVTWRKVLDGSIPSARSQAVVNLEQWKVDDDLSSIRTPEALAKLPEAERKEWQALWAEFEVVLARAKTLAAMADRLPAMLKGEDRPKDNPERLVLAQLCYDAERFAAAARFWAEALEADPKLGDDRQAPHRYNAACAAALSGTGSGKEEPPPDDALKAKLRGQALGWLKAELVAWTKVLETGPDPLKAKVTLTLQYWKSDSDLASLREADALAKLPEAKRKEWQAFWVEVDALLKRAQGPKP